MEEKLPKTLEEMFIKEYNSAKIELYLLKKSANEDNKRFSEAYTRLQRKSDFLEKKLESCEKLLMSLKYNISGDLIEIHPFSINGRFYDKPRIFEEIKEVAEKMAKGEWYLYDEK